MAKITLYENSNYGGRSLEITAADSNLGNEGFNDKASSCKVESGTWILYKDVNFGGSYSILKPGEYSNSDAMGLQNDSLSSLRPLPESGICLFRDSYFGGRMVVLTGALSNFKTIDFNDEVSSAIVISDTWHLYKDSDFKGADWRLGVGNYATSDSGGFINDAVSSAKPD